MKCCLNLLPARLKFMSALLTLVSFFVYFAERRVTGDGVLTFGASESF